MVKPVQINLAHDYIQTSGQQGSNPGGFFRHRQTGQEYYIKWLPEKLSDQYKDGKKPSDVRFKNRNLNRVQNEYLALKLYELFDIAVPKATLITFTKPNGDVCYGIATEKETNITRLSTAMLNNNVIKQKIQEDFLIDALLSNYDVAGLSMDNIFWHSASNKPLRLDSGAALKYRAQGAPKRGQFNENVDEFEEMESGRNTKTGFNPDTLLQTSRLFKGVHQSKALSTGLRKLLTISDQAIIDCINEHGFDAENPTGQAKNQQLIDLLLARKKRLIEKAEAKIFNQLIVELYRSPCSKNDKTYQQFNGNDKNPIYRVKHGGMHASRVALHTEAFISLLQENNYPSAMDLTAKDRYLIKVAALFHDSGRLCDQGDDNQAWEASGAEKCRQWLTTAGFEPEDIEKVCEAITHKDDVTIQNTNIIALVLAAADSLDWVRSHGSDFDINRLPATITAQIPTQQLLDAATKAKLLATIQGDSPRAQLDQNGAFSIATKRKYEQNPSGCYQATRQVFEVLKVSQAVIEQRRVQFDKILNYFKIESYAKYNDPETRQSIDSFITDLKQINDELACRYSDDNQYKNKLEERILESAFQAFPHRNNIIRFVLDLIIFPFCFIKKAVTGSWFFSTADTNRVRLIKNELIDLDEALSEKKWERFVQLVNRGEPITEPIKNAASEGIVNDRKWNLAFELEKTFSQEKKYVPTQGPQLKSVYTTQLELLAHQLLTAEPFKVERSGKANILTFDSGEVFNLSKLFKHANMAHLCLKSDDFSRYEQKYLGIYMKSWCRAQASRFPNLSSAEMSAINEYTGTGSAYMNAILRDKYSYTGRWQSTIRIAILSTLMCASGLAKTPECKIADCYRGENIFDRKEHGKRIRAAAVHGVVPFSGFVSTSVTRGSEFGGSVKWSIKNLTGKYIAPLSQYPFEQEFLVLPTYVQVVDYNYQYSQHAFTGVMVSDLAALEEPEEDRHLNLGP